MATSMNDYLQPTTTINSITTPIIDELMEMWDAEYKRKTVGFRVRITVVSVVLEHFLAAPTIVGLQIWKKALEAWMIKAKASQRKERAPTKVRSFHINVTSYATN